MLWRVTVLLFLIRNVLQNTTSWPARSHRIISKVTMAYGWQQEEDEDKDSVIISDTVMKNRRDMKSDDI